MKKVLAIIVMATLLTGCGATQDSDPRKALEAAREAYNAACVTVLNCEYLSDDGAADVLNVVESICQAAGKHQKFSVEFVLRDEDEQLNRTFSLSDKELLFDNQTSRLLLQSELLHDLCDADGQLVTAADLMSAKQVTIEEVLVNWEDDGMQFWLYDHDALFVR